MPLSYLRGAIKEAVGCEAKGGDLLRIELWKHM